MTDPVEVAAIPTEDVATETPKSRREIAMEQIEASRAEAFAAEMAEHAPEPEPEAAPEVAAEPAPEPDQLASQLIDPNDKVKVKVKIDGVEEEIPLQDILRNYQKGSAADRRLEEATRLLRDAEERSRVTAPPAAPEKAPEPEATDAGIKGKVKDALARLYEGDEDAAAEALAALIGKPSAKAETPQFDTAALTQEIRQQLAAESAFETIKTDYPEVLSNPDLDMLASIKAERMMSEGKPRHEALLAAVREVAEKTGKGRPTPVHDQTTTRDEKLAAKANLDNVKTANVAASNAANVEDTSPSAVMAAMAAKRLGQTMAMRN